MKNSKKVEDNILRAARKIFTLHGRKGATMAEIAEEAGISRTLLNYYYRDKDKLFEGVFNDILTHFLPNINEAFEDNSSIMEKIGRAIDIYTDVLLENPDIPVFIINQIVCCNIVFNIFDSLIDGTLTNKFVKFLVC